MIAFITYYFFWSCNEKKQSVHSLIARHILDGIDSFIVAKNNLDNALKNTNQSEKNMQNLFLQLRLSYKNIEWAIEYFTPVNARLINGPPVQEAESNHTVLEPCGLQIIEPFIFPKYNSAKKTEITQQLQLLQGASDKIKVYFKNIDLLDWQIFDASKMEVFRLEILGITGFDNPLTLNSLHESATALSGIKWVMKNYVNKDRDGKLLPKLDAAISYLSTNIDFDSFNRAEFIIHYADPVSISLEELKRKLNIPEIIYKRLLRQDALTLSDSNAFDAYAYTLDTHDSLSAIKIELGSKLFADPILSANGKQSCLSCHQPDKAFTDGLVKNIAINNSKPLVRNTPTLINAAFQPSLFYDLRVNTLEEQAADVVHNSSEMNGSLKLAMGKLLQNGNYKKLFLSAFPNAKKEDLDSSEILVAISYYLRTLVSPSSRFDKYMRGDTSALKSTELSGFNLFMGKAKCATCHYFPLFNGTFPPRYMKSDAEVIGVPFDKNETKADTDMGVYNITKIASLKRAFKTPTVRNATFTAPYMHNGVFSSLEEVINFYNKGGGNGLGFRLSNQTLPETELHLSEQEKAQLIAFIKSLSQK